MSEPDDDVDRYNAEVDAYNARVDQENAEVDADVRDALARASVGELLRELARRVFP